jgi:plasmid stabilization system protein ParE
MTYILTFRPEVEEDAVFGYLWYEDKATGLGKDYLRLVYACSGKILRNPLMYRKVHGEFRRGLLKKFPYAIYFRIEGNKVIVFGLFHSARNPENIEDSLDDRDNKVL